MSDERTIDVLRQAENGDWIVVGTWVMPKPGRPGAFVYDDEYEGPPLCPQFDHRGGERIFTHHPTANPNVRGASVDDLPHVLAQCLPGRWGDLVLASHSPTWTRSSPAERLWQLGDWRAGGLRLQASGMDFEVYFETQGALQALQRRVDEFIQRFASERVCPFALGRPEHRWALSSYGGDQPKAAYRDLHTEEEFVVKFPREVIGTYQEARVEEALLRVAREAGLPTVESTLVSNADNTSFLMTRRFDLDDRGHAVHVIPGSTALGAGAQSRVFDYEEVARFLSSHSADPERDVEALFGRMVLNRAANNTDDHLDQFVFLQDPESGKFRLAPTFDVLVTELDAHGNAGQHAMAMCGDREPALTASWIKQAGARFGIDEHRAVAIAADVLEAVQRFPAIAAECGVRPESLQNDLTPAMALEAAARVAAQLRAEQSASAGMQL